MAFSATKTHVSEKITCHLLRVQSYRQRMKKTRGEEEEEEEEEEIEEQRLPWLLVSDFIFFASPRSLSESSVSLPWPGERSASSSDSLRCKILASG